MKTRLIMGKNISKNNLFIAFGIFFLLFTFIWNILNNLYLSWTIFLLLLILLLNFFIYTKKYLTVLIFILLWAILWITSSNLANIVISTKVDTIDKYLDIKYLVKLEITGINKVKDYESEYKVKIISLSKIVKNSNKLDSTLYLEKKEFIEWLIVIPSNFDIKIWDIIQVKEKIRKIENFNNNFNYKKFSYSKNIFFKINAWSINNVWRVDNNFILDKIIYFRKIMLSKIKQLYPEEEWIFLWWILLWARESMSEDLKIDFNNSGLTHFIAVSGFNITILVVFLSYLLKIFPSIIRIILITLSIWWFVILVWDSVSVVRASIMWLIAYYILVSWRSVHNLGLLIFVWIIMVIISPLSINYDISFHLSFLAVLWILYTQKFFEKIFFWLPNFLAIREAFVLTLSAMSFALPVIIFNFGQVSILSPIANIAVAWTIPLAMIWWFISLLVDYVHHWFWIWLSYLTWVLLAWDIKIVHLFGGLDWAIIKYEPWIYKNTFQIFYFMILIFLINYFSTERK